MAKPFADRETSALGFVLVFFVGGPVGALLGYVLSLSLGVAGQARNDIVAVTYLAGNFCMAVAVVRWCIKNKTH